MKLTQVSTKGANKKKEAPGPEQFCVTKLRQLQTELFGVKG